MARITVEDCLERENNRFALVLLAAKRTKQLLHGSNAVIDDTRDNKAVVTSLREIAAGKVRFKTEEDLEKEREEARRAREREMGSSAAEIPLPTLSGPSLGAASGSDSEDSSSSGDSENSGDGESKEEEGAEKSSENGAGSPDGVLF